MRSNFPCDFAPITPVPIWYSDSAVGLANEILKSISIPSMPWKKHVSFMDTWNEEEAALVFYLHLVSELEMQISTLIAAFCCRSYNNLLKMHIRPCTTFLKMYTRPWTNFRQRPFYSFFFLKVSHQNRYRSLQENVRETMPSGRHVPTPKLSIPSLV